MSKQSLSLRLSFAACLLSGLVACGCKEQPEVPFSEYGETIDHLPVIEDLPRAYPISDEIEGGDCRIREEAERSARYRLLESQGRGMELQLEEQERLSKKETIELPVKEEEVEETVVEEAVEPAEEAAVEEAAEPAEEAAVEEAAEPVEEAAAEEAAEPAEEAVVEEAAEPAAEAPISVGDAEGELEVPAADDAE